MTATSNPAQRYPFFASWVITTVLLGWQLLEGQVAAVSQFSIFNLLALFLCTVTLLAQTPNPIEEVPAQESTKTGLFILLLVVSAGILFLIPTQVVRVLFFILPGIAILVLVLLKQPLSKREHLYALGLALLAGLTGWGEGRIPWASPVVWSILQVFLVLTSLLAGWSILHYTALNQEGVGKSIFLSNGVGPAFNSFMIGMLIAVPWALWNIWVAESNLEAWELRDGWINAWWQPILALQPGIAEEAWGRIFLVPLFFLIFRLVSLPRAAFTAALFVVGYWFAYLHTPGRIEWNSKCNYAGHSV